MSKITASAAGTITLGDVQITGVFEQPILGLPRDFAFPDPMTACGRTTETGWNRSSGTHTTTSS